MEPHVEDGHTVFQRITAFEPLSTSVLPAVVSDCQAPYSRNAVQCDLLLLEVPPVLFIDKDQAEEVACGEFLVNVAEGWGQLEASQEQADGNGLAPDRSPVHDLELCDRLGLVVQVRCRSGRFTTDDRELHMFNLDADEKEVDLADNNVLQVIPDGVSPDLSIVDTDFGLLNSNSMCKQSSMPTSIFSLVFVFGGMWYECTQKSRSFVTSPIRRIRVTRMKYLPRQRCRAKFITSASRLCPNNFRTASRRS